MIKKVKVTKNIMNKGGVIFNLSVSQLIWLGIAVIVGLGTFFLLKDYIITDVLMWIIFGEVSIIAGIGVIRINELNLFMFLLKILKGADKRPYSNTKGVYDKDEFTLF